MAVTIPVRSINPDGTAVLADGREVQLVVGRQGVLGVAAITQKDQVAGLDQVSEAPETFDTSGLDQPVGPPR